MFRAAAMTFGLLASMSVATGAQAESPAAMNGRALVNQHCGVCHTKPDVNHPQFGPSLDQSLLASASAADITNFISVGAPDMPGFALTLNSDQIDSIVAYIKETPAAPKAPTAAVSGAGASATTPAPTGSPPPPSGAHAPPAGATPGNDD